MVLNSGLMARRELVNKPLWVAIATFISASMTGGEGVPGAAVEPGVAVAPAPAGAPGAPVAPAAAGCDSGGGGGAVPGAPAGAPDAGGASFAAHSASVFLMSAKASS